MKRSISATPAKMKIALEHERAEDAPEQHPVLVLAGHGEVAEDQRPDEDVVDAQALLDEVARHVLTGGLAAEGPPHHEREPETDRDPHARFDRRFLRLDVVRLAVEHEEVDEQQHQDQPDQRRPHPGFDIEIGEVLGRRRTVGGEKEDGVHFVVLSFLLLLAAMTA